MNPETISGIGISLQMVFGAIAGGMFVRLGPTVGAAFTLLLAEGLRVAVGHDVHGLDATLYGLMLVLFIIFMPKGILGAAQAAWEKRYSPAEAFHPRRAVPSCFELAPLLLLVTRLPSIRSKPHCGSALVLEGDEPARLILLTRYQRIRGDRSWS